MSDTESVIPEEEIPKIEKKTRKKKEMTPEMIEQLRLARIKAMEVKKALKGNPEARIEHYKEKLKQQKEKPTKKKLLEKAKDILKEEESEEIVSHAIEKEVKEEPSVEIAPHTIEGVKGETPLDDDELDNNGLPKPPKQAIKKPEPEPSNYVDLSTDEKIIEEPIVKTKKKVRYVYESDTDSEEERVVYVKKNNKKETPIPRKVPVPSTFGGNVNRFGSYGMFGRRM